MRVRFPAALCLAVAMVAASCGGVIDPSKNKDETFSGTVDVNGAGTVHVFDSGNGEFEIRITALAPAIQYIGVFYGRPSGNDCSPEGSNNFSQLNLAALAGRINSGRHCVFVYDSGLVTGPTAYTMIVSHP